MPKRKIKKTIIGLFRFLKNHNAYSNYISQTEKHLDSIYNYTYQRPILVNFLEEKDPLDYLISSFSWAETKEGFNYWYNLDNQWGKNYRKLCKR